MDDYIEHISSPCPMCREFQVMRWECCAFGCFGEGWYDGYEYDNPLRFSPGELVMCDECQGHGHHMWCSGCGYDLLEKRYLNGAPE